MCSSSWAAAAIFSSKSSANICSSSSSESMYGQAIGRTPAGRVDEEQREGAARRWNIERGHDGRRNIGCWVEERRSSGNRPADCWRARTSVPSPKYKHKNNGPPVKVILYMDEHCEHKVQLKAERVHFIKSWSKFVGKAQLDVDDTIVFTPTDNDFQVEVYRKETSYSSIWSCNNHHHGPYANPRR
ncbi:hypothetical protein QYE76_025673 [Lolium multiflorum]|uniref:TF-B3 domain-containing protein n=1 Tax=Lolium multiflorum TaxID=4521 RepID=A0AAD8RG80_LOLMU|nr:hypothetical protein QYE76_025673 [Lolium multiflorum]